MTVLLWLAGCPAPHRYPDGTGLEGQLEREVIALSQHVRELEARVEACGATGDPDALYAELQQVFRGSEVEVDRVGNVTVLTIRASHLFADPYRQVLRGEARPTLDLLAIALNLHPDYEVLVVGHVDDRPVPKALARVYATPLELSARLAHAVVDALVEDFGCSPQNLGIAGRGPYRPRASNDLESGRDANLRIEVWLAPRGAAWVPADPPPE